MDIPKEKIKSAIASFITVVLLFSGGWYYLDKKRMEAVKEHQEALKLKTEADLKFRMYAEREQSLAKKEKELDFRLLERSRDKELSDLTLKFIDEVSGINFHVQCVDDPEHNEKARKANALLDIIEAKALEYGRNDIVEKFVNHQRAGIDVWSAKCKP